MNRLAVIGAGFAILSCYGTTALIGLLSLLGVSLVLNAHVWAGVIVLAAGLAVVGLLLGWGRHGRIGPSAFGVVGLGLVAWVMLVSYDARLEATGFVALLAAVVWDRRLRIPSCVKK